MLKSIRREVEEEGLKLSITEGGKEGKSKVIASLQLSGREVSGMQRESRRRSCKQRGNSKSRFEDGNEAIGSKREGQKEEL